MRILHVITKLELGGAQQNTLFTCRRLAERGHEVTLAAGPGGMLDDEAAAGPFAFERLRHLVRPISPWHDPLAVLEVARLVRRLRPDVVHTHSSKAGAVGRLGARLGGATVVIHTVHGWSFSDRQPAGSRRAYMIIEKLSSYLSTHVASVSRDDVDYGLKHHVLSRSDTSVIRSGIDIASFAMTLDPALRGLLRHSLGVQDGEILVLNVSCLKPQKAPLDFVRAAALALREEPRLRFVLVGDGELRAAVEAAVAAAGLGDRFTLAGWRRDVPDLMRAADLLALTSLWEGLPRVVLQARAAGTPVVATRVNGTPEAIEDGVHGFLVAPAAPDEVARRLVELARDPALRARMSAAGPRSLQEFDQEAMVLQQEALYERLRSRTPAAVVAHPQVRP